MTTPTLKSDVDPTVIDWDVFTQILDLDEDDENHDFSRGMVLAYFAQAKDTLDKMDEALCVFVLQPQGRHRVPDSLPILFVFIGANVI